MNFIRRAVLAVALAAIPADGEGNWAVIVAGSNGFWNYRHQADVCHAYHVVRRNGIPEERVILMSYGDVADHVDNPVRGTLYNKPTPEGVPGYDLNHGCKLAYAGGDVNADNFLAVLKGDNKTTGGKPVLQSTKEDRVFVYFADHGGVGLVAMPSGPPVYAQDLIDALRYMWANGMYKELVFYMEACESGSMFDGLLPTDANIYAMTAANAHESSFGTYCGTDSSVDGTVIGSCLGDLFSVNWLENSDEPSFFHTETLDSQFEILKNETTKSHVQKFGTSKMGVEPIDWFQGARDFPSERRGRANRAAVVAGLPIPKNGVSSRNIKLHTLHQKWKLSNSGWEKEKIKRQMKRIVLARRSLAQTFDSIVRETTGSGDDTAFLSGTFTEHACLKSASTSVIAHCGPWDDDSLKYVRVLATLCQAGYGSMSISAAAEKACASAMS